MIAAKIFCTLDYKEPIHIKLLQRDTDVIPTIQRIEANNSKTLHIYVKHNVDIPVDVGLVPADLLEWPSKIRGEVHGRGSGSVGGVNNNADHSEGGGG